MTADNKKDWAEVTAAMRTGEYWRTVPLWQPLSSTTLAYEAERERLQAEARKQKQRSLRGSRYGT